MVKDFKKVKLVFPFSDGSESRVYFGGDELDVVERDFFLFFFFRVGLGVPLNVFVEAAFKQKRVKRGTFRVDS